MCTTSAVFDRYYEHWRPNQYVVPHIVPSQQEIDEFRTLLEKARQWDREHGQPECEMEEKRRKLKDLADELGVQIEFATE